MVDKEYKKKRNNAHRKYLHALYGGQLVKPERCEQCDKFTHIVGHHDNYDKPLEVRWLCRSCHMKNHGIKPQMYRYFGGRPVAQWGKQWKMSKEGARQLIWEIIDYYKAQGIDLTKIKKPKAVKRVL